MVVLFCVWLFSLFRNTFEEVTISDILHGVDPVSVDNADVSFESGEPLLMTLFPSRQYSMSLSCSCENGQDELYVDGEMVNVSSLQPTYISSATLSDESFFYTSYLVFLVHCSSDPVLDITNFEREERTMNSLSLQGDLSELGIIGDLRSAMNSCLPIQSCGKCVFSHFYECGWYGKGSVFSLYEGEVLVLSGTFEDGVCGDITFKNVLYVEQQDNTKDGYTWYIESNSQPDSYFMCINQQVSFFLWIVIFLIICCCCCCCCGCCLTTGIVGVSILGWALGCPLLYCGCCYSVFCCKADFYKDQKKEFNEEEFEQFLENDVM